MLKGPIGLGALRRGVAGRRALGGRETGLSGAKVRGIVRYGPGVALVVWVGYMINFMSFETWAWCGEAWGGVGPSLLLEQAWSDDCYGLGWF